jgi:hypothetical protein
MPGQQVAILLLLLGRLAHYGRSVDWLEVHRFQAPAVGCTTTAAANGGHRWTKLKSAARRQKARRLAGLWHWHTRPGVLLQGRHPDPADAARKAQRLRRQLLRLGIGQRYGCKASAN